MNYLVGPAFVLLAASLILAVVAIVDGSWRTVVSSSLGVLAMAAVILTWLRERRRAK